MKEVHLYSAEDAGLLMAQNVHLELFWTAFHELLGHGCGKLLMQREDGSFNFDPALKDPFTGQPVGYYRPGQTWSSVFQGMSNGVEECRAEAISLYFSCVPEALAVLDPAAKGREEEICYVSYLMFVKMGFDAMLYYDPATRKWGQAHMNGRFVILRILLEAGQDFIRVERYEEGGQPRLRVRIDRSQIHTTGKKALSSFLFKLNLYKATANA